MDPYIGAIFFWPVSWAPQGYYFCEGQQLAIQEYTALFSILGFRYGGDNYAYFNLPDLRGAVGLGVGQFPGLSPYVLSQEGGVNTVTLNNTQMPTHAHSLMHVAMQASNTPVLSIPDLTSSVNGAKLPISTSGGNATIPGSNAVPAKAPPLPDFGDNYIYGSSNGSAGINVNAAFSPYQYIDVKYNAQAKGLLGAAGGGAAHNNMQPYSVVNYIICWDGIYPPFSD